jgi:hypothetical protein
MKFIQNQDVESFFDDFEGQQADILWFLHRQILNYPAVHGKIRFKIPFYDRKSWICYLNPLKNGQVELAFIRGSELSDYGGWLQTRGRKQVTGALISHIDEIPHELLHAALQEALHLDDTSHYSLRKK